MELKQLLDTIYRSQRPNVANSDESIAESVFHNDYVRMTQVVLARAYANHESSAELDELAASYKELIETGTWPNP